MLELIEKLEMNSPIRIKKFDDDPRALMEYWENLYMRNRLKNYNNKKQL